MRRTLDAAFLNEVANDPAVRPWLGGQGALDLTPIIADPANIALEGDHGGFVLTRQESGVYEAHSLFLPSGRGALAAQMMLDGFRYLFTATDCVEVQTKVPTNNRMAAGFATLAGFDLVFCRTGVWDGADVDYGVLTLDRWRARDPEIAAHGHWFHERIEAAKIQAGSQLPVHPDDEAHDRAAGAAVLMCRAHNPRKAVWSYNRWARLAGYQTLELLSEHPAVLDVRDAVIELRGEDMEVLLCR